MEKYNSYIIRMPGDNSPAVCMKCGNDKPPTDYYSHSVRGDGAIRYRPYCKACRIKGKRTNWSRPVHAKIIDEGVQHCKYCNVIKPLDCFYANGCFADGTKKYRSRCIECVLKKAKETHIKCYETKSKKRSSSPKNFMTGILNHACKRKMHMGFNIDLGYLMDLYDRQKGFCALSGIFMTYEAGAGRVNTNISIDRIDSNVGYIRGNVQLVCDVVNRMKQDLPLSVFLSLCKTIWEKHNGVQNPSVGTE